MRFSVKRGTEAIFLLSSVPESGSRAAECLQTEEGSDNTLGQKGWGWPRLVEECVVKEARWLMLHSRVYAVSDNLLMRDLFPETGDFVPVSRIAVLSKLKTVENETRELRVQSQGALVMPKRGLRKPGVTAQLKLWFQFAFLLNWVYFPSGNFTRLPAMQEIAWCHKTSCRICTHQQTCSTAL